MTAFGRVWAVEALRPDTVFCESAALATRYPTLPVLLGASGALLVKMLLVAFAGHWLQHRFPLLMESFTRGTMIAVFLLLVYRLLWYRPGLPGTQDRARKPEGPACSLVGGESAPFWRVFALAFAALFCAEWFDAAQISLLWVVDHTPGPGIAVALWAGLGAAAAMICKEGVGILAVTPLQRMLSFATIRWTIAACCLFLAAHVLVEK